MTFRHYPAIDESISRVEDAIGWVFSDKRLCATALQKWTKLGITVTFGGSEHSIQHNEMLELMGDSIIDLVLCKKWVQIRKNKIVNKAFWNEARQTLAGNSGLADRGRSLGLDAFIIKNPGTEVSDGMMADTFEAIIGAVFWDAGDDGQKAVHDVLKHLGFFDHPFLSLPNMEDSRSGDKKNSGVDHEKGPKALLTIT